MHQSKHLSWLSYLFANLIVASACLIACTSRSAEAGDTHQRLIAMTDQVRGMCAEAEQLINQGKIGEAIRVLARANAADPSCAEVHGYLGQAYQNSSKPQLAIAEYQKALQLSPQAMSFINVNIGNCYLNLSQPQSAVPFFEKYLSDNPGAADAAQVRQSIANAAGQSSGLSVRSLVEQGQSFLNEKRFDDAQAVFRRALSLSPNFAPAHFYLGYSLAGGGHPDQAIGEFEQTLTLDPTLTQAMINIGSNYQTMGDAGNAITWYEKYLQQCPDSPKASDIRGRVTALRKQAHNMPQPVRGAANAQDDQDYLASITNGGTRYWRWPTQNMPLKVFIARGSAQSGFRDSYGQALLDAFKIWAQAAPQRISFVLVNNPAQSDVYCDWTTDANQVQGAGGAGEGAVTKLNATPQGNSPVVNIHQARVVILTISGAGQPIEDEALKRVCLHEVGHALGLNGHSLNNQDIMFFSETFFGTPTLSPRDIATINRLYSFGSMPAR